MREKNNSKFEFFGLLTFLAIAVLVMTNGFVGRISAEEKDIFYSIEPIADVLDRVMKSHVEDPDIDKLVEGALSGIMSALDRHSEYISPEQLEQMTEETEGQFDGIGISIKLDDMDRIMVFQPIAGSPAQDAGIHAGDLITAIDGESAEGMSLSDAAERIRGPRGTVVTLTILRLFEEDGEVETFDVEVKRGKIPLVSILESRLLEGGIGYIRISDFKKNTPQELTDEIRGLIDEGMHALVLDMRWNPGGLLTASKEVTELFLPKNTLVTYTKGRESADGSAAEKMELYTDRSAVLPDNLPMVILVNEWTASASEIVTGALQFYARAIVVGEQTFGKGSVQTVIPLRRPEGSALRLTTALYYTPARVTINNQGIKPDVHVEMSKKDQVALLRQMRESYADDPDRRDEQNHGSVTGDEVTEDTVEDVQLKQAVEILSEDTVFSNLLAKYHQDTSLTQIEAENISATARGRDIRDATENPTADEEEELDLVPVP